MAEPHVKVSASVRKPDLIDFGERAVRSVRSARWWQTLRTSFGLLIFASILIRTSAAIPQQTPKVMPVPARMQLGTGQFVIDASFSVGIRGAADSGLQHPIELFLNNLRRQTGMPPLAMKVTNASQAKLVVQADHARKDVQELGEGESYRLEIDTTGAKLTAETTLGILHGLQTFLQLLQTTPEGFAIPTIAIQDEPRFPWRGLMIDVSRHFTPLEVLKRNLDGMAAVKLNVFHWHLSDDQGFRIESKRFPKLQEMGSDGLYYTQDEVRELIAYARERGIRVVPEFDMPGHSTAWFVGYPELASAPGPYQIERKWGIFDPVMDPTEERTYKFLDKFIGEMANLFPDKYFHIGGDEVNGKQWDASSEIQSFIRAHGFHDNQDLQAYFNKRVQKIIWKHGKIMIGWDEILRPDLSKGVVVQSWREPESLTAAAKQGFRSLASFGYYLNAMWPASQHYAVDPMNSSAAELNPDEKQRVLGGEGCMWSEYVSPENIDSRIWPRMAAIAERLWSAQDVKDESSMYKRLEEVSHRLDWLGLAHTSSYEPMLRRIAGSGDISSLRVLADVVEPVKRGAAGPVEPTSLVPLNRLVDAARPESATARHFAHVVDAITADSADQASNQYVKTFLSRWRDNQASLRTQEAKSFLLKEVIPLSQTLSVVASVGLQALEYIDRGERAPDSWKAGQLALLQQAQQQQAQLLLMVIPPVQRLVEISAGQGTPSPQK